MEYKITTYGKIEEKLIKAITNSIDYTFLYLSFNGKKPEIHIAEGLIILSSGEDAFATYDVDNQIIRLSKKAGERSTGYQKGDLNIQEVLCVYGSHEATHHVQNLRGEPRFNEIIANDRKTRLEDRVRNHPLELEANKIAGIVFELIYNKHVKLF